MIITPLLSVGIIFKNEERCLERCLKSLDPLRQAIPCEVVMADTGAEDGSREIAEQYADEVFDFPWVNDFAAARNAVMDRCKGKWYLTIDCDEWLDADVSELVAFVKGRKRVDFAFVIQRNYNTIELEKSDGYGDFRALRLMRMSTGERYHGAIHESWYYREPAERLLHTILHHDGYFFTDPKSAKKKSQRNMKLLREKLAADPENLGTLNQCIESGGSDADLIQYIRRALKIVLDKRGLWEALGGSILRHAVEAAAAREMPELEEWTGLAETLFPDSIFIQVDANHAAFRAAYDAKEWEKAIHYGEAYRKGLKNLRAPHPSKAVERELATSTIHAGDPLREHTLLTGLADAYLQTGQGEKALDILAQLEGSKLQPGQVKNVVVALSQLHAQTQLGIEPTLLAFYEQINRKEPDEKKQKARLAAFDYIASAAFKKAYLKEEQEHEGYWRPAYTAFAALADKCETGRAAAILTCEMPDEMQALLEKVEDWAALPIEALEHALQAGVAFPLAEKPLPIEVMDGLAAQMTHGGNLARQMALEGAQEPAGLQGLYWAQALTLAAVRSFDWNLGKDEEPISAYAAPEKKKAPEEKPPCTPEIGLELTRRFVQVESALLPLLYAPQALTEENAVLLPSMHRWGLYCGRALQALDGGDPHAYLAILRRGIEACPGQKKMAQFLIDRFNEELRPQPSPELLALAEKVRALLFAYSPEDPAVLAIRNSEAYQKVAWLIEEAPEA